jgi:hypothetical protein
MKRGISVLLAMLTLVTAASGQSRSIFVNGAELHSSCKGTPDVCLGYITAVADALESFKPPLPSTCRTSVVSLQEVVDLAMEVLEADTTDLRRPAINILADAFSAEWPC